MRMSIRSFFVTAAVLMTAPSAFSLDKAYFDVTQVQITEVKDLTSSVDTFAQAGLDGNCSANLPLTAKFSDDASFGSLNPLETIELIVDQIINIGKKIFNVVEAGRPVVNIKMDTANALPRGLTCWADLSGWNRPASKVFNVKYQNALGMTVVDFSYRLTYTAGGSADGVGKYITNATFQPANVYVAWGFKFDATAEIPSVFNTGSKADPVAGMQMMLDWKVTSPLAHIQQAESYFVSGTNELVQLEDRKPVE